MIKVTVGCQDVALDLSRTLAQSGIRPGSTLKLKLAGLLGGMPTGREQRATAAEKEMGPSKKKGKRSSRK